MHLLRDTSEKIIKLGRSYMTLQQGEDARKCFVTAETLQIYANDVNPTLAPVLDQLLLLQGPNGLIQQARDL
ncbi:unnamed protein product, partial [Rotaria sp. Silwood2]